MIAKPTAPKCESAVRQLIPTARPPKAGTIELGPEDAELLDKLLGEMVEYTDHPRFKERGIEVKLFGAIAKPTAKDSTHFVPPTPLFLPEKQRDGDLPTLTTEQEQLFFKRLNFARMQVWKVLKSYAGRRLSAAATRKLLGWAHRALAIRGEIVRLNMPLVLAMAKRTRLSGIDFNELISEGNMALLRSVGKFDCSRGFKFSTYSCRAILKSFSRVAMRTSRYRTKFPVEFDPTLEKSDYMEQKRNGVELDCVSEVKQIIQRNLANLNDVEETVIRERFAISATPADAQMPKTLEQVGQVIGVTKERVRQIQNKALAKIREALEDNYLAA